MLLVKAAEKIIFDLIPSLGDNDRETVDLLSSTGRILAAPVIGNYDIPPWTNSAMDGYAVHYEDVEHCSPQHPVVLRVIEEIPAGKIPQRAIERGEAARIYTGAMLPEGADAIVIQETTKLEVRPEPAPDPYQENATPANLELAPEINLETNPDQLLTSPPQPSISTYIWVLEAPNSREFVRHRGSFYQAGADLLPSGIRIGAPEIAVLAAVQCTQIPVYRPLKVAILSTGDELVNPEQPLAPGQIVDSNQYALAALVKQAGAVPILMGIVPDQQDTLRDAIARAVFEADIVLSTGGVSVGDYDYVDRLLAELGAVIHVKSIGIKPGKPMTVATFAGEPKPVLYFGIPGNPVSALVTFWRFVEPVIKKMSGLTENWQPQWVTAHTRDHLKADGKRESYLWGRVQLQEGSYKFSLSGGSHSSANLINLSQTNALAVVPIGTTAIPAGGAVRVLLIPQ